MFDNEAIRQLWDAGDAFRNVAINSLIENFHHNPDLFFTILVSQGGSELAEAATRSMPFLTGGMGSEQRQAATRTQHAALTCPDTTASTGPFADMEPRLQFFLDKLKDEAGRCADPASFLARVCELFPGIEGDVAVMFPAATLPVHREKESRQLMVFVCGQCNLHCPYCFSHDLDRREISPADLHRIFAWAKREGFDRITPCGGEPLLYSSLPAFMELIAESGMTTYMASNFTIPISGLPGFTADILKKIYVHFTPETESTPRLKSTLERNIEIAKSRSIDVSARANLTDTNLAEALGWIQLATERGMRCLNIALTIPSRLHTNAFTNPRHFHEFIAVICRMVEEADRRGLMLGIAKPMPLCMFPRDIADRLMAWNPAIALCGIHCAGGMNNLSLSTDLCFSPCLGLSGIRIPFEDSMRYADLSKSFAPLVENLLNRPADEKCHTCFLYRRGLCQGYCLSYKICDEPLMHNM